MQINKINVSSTPSRVLCANHSLRQPKDIFNKKHVGRLKKLRNQAWCSVSVESDVLINHDFPAFPLNLCSWEVHLYTAGFPCTPYSSLGNQWLLADKNSRQLFRCVSNVKVTKPRVSKLKSSQV